MILVTQPLRKVFVGGLLAAAILGLYSAAYLSLPPPAPPRPTSLEDMILYYGGCNEYRQARHEQDVLMEELRPTNGLPPPSYDDRAIASAKRKLWEAETAAACRKMGHP